jgi:hypothetical protein
MEWGTVPNDAVVTPGADQSFNIGLHQQLQRCLRQGSQKISLASHFQQLGQRQSLFGHRVLSGSGRSLATSP